MENEDRIVILNHIKSICKRRMILPVVVIILMVALLFIVPFFKVWNPKDVNGVFNVKSSNQFVSLKTGPMKYTGYDVTNGMGIKFSYYYALKDGKCAFALIPKNKVKDTGKDLPDGSVKESVDNVTFNAKVIKPNATYKKMVSMFAKDLNWTDEGLQSISTSVLASGADYHPYRYALIFGLIVFLLMAALIRLVLVIRSLKDPYSFPVYFCQSKQELHDLIDEAQDELDSENYLQINATYITENYFIDMDRTTAFVIPFKDVVWVYRLGRRGFDIKKQALTYTIYFITRDGEMIKVKRKSSDEAMAIMKSIKATEYEIITGHSDEKRKKVEELFNSSSSKQSVNPEHNPNEYRD